MYLGKIMSKNRISAEAKATLLVSRSAAFASGYTWR